MIKTKQVLIALAVIGANVLHNMPVHTSLAATNTWYGDATNVSGWRATSGGMGGASNIRLTGANLTLDGTESYVDENSTASPPEKIAFADVDIFCGGYTSGSETVTNNSITFNTPNTPTIGATIYGGQNTYNGGAAATDNHVIIENGNFSDSNNKYICGGYSSKGVADKNTVTIKDGNFPRRIFGGWSNGSGGDATNNIVTIEGGTFSGNNAWICGGVSSGGNATGNTVTIKGGTFNDNFSLYGGYTTGTSTNNTLNLKIKMGGKASVVKYFQNMNFTLPTGIQAGEIMLETASVTYDSTKVNVNSDTGVSLKKDDQIYLIKADAGAGDIDITNLTVLDGAAKVSLEEGKNLILTFLTDFSTDGGGDKQKAPVEGIAAVVQTVNMSADLASGEGMRSLMLETVGGFTNTFGALTAGHSKYKTGSHVDVDGWGVVVGAGKTKDWGNGEATSLGVFLEYGKGNFDTYNGSIHGDGNSENKGIGFMMRHKMLNNTYYEGNIRYGKVETDWSESEVGGYNTDSKYYGISVGMGHIFPAGKNEIDVYGRYTYGHVGSSDARVGTKDYHFDSVKSHRVRIGGKYNFKQKNSNAKPFVGLAWEHEFKGESKASIAGVGEAPAPSMKGNTGIMEVGCDWNLGKKWTAGISADAYVGKRKGWDGMARIFYNF